MYSKADYIQINILPSRFKTNTSNNKLLTLIILNIELQKRYLFEYRYAVKFEIRIFYLYFSVFVARSFL